MEIGNPGGIGLEVAGERYYEVAIEIGEARYGECVIGSRREGRPEGWKVMVSRSEATGTIPGTVVPPLASMMEPLFTEEALIGLLVSIVMDTFAGTLVEVSGGLTEVTVGRVVSVPARVTKQVEFR